MLKTERMSSTDMKSYQIFIEERDIYERKDPLYRGYF